MIIEGLDGNPGTVAVTKRGGIGLQGKFSANDLNQYVNPAADPRLNSILTKMNSPLKQGIIQQTDDNVQGPQKYPFACRFMFNPTTLSVGYQAIESGIDPSEQTAAQQAAVAIGVGQTTLAFNLLFDRTYEVAYGPGKTRPTDLRDIGVYRDIAALESVVKARDNFAPAADAVITPMTLVPCYFVFGGGAGKVGLTFIGAITSMTVDYSTFSDRMVPMRAAVTLQVTQHLGRSFNDFGTKGGTLLQRAQERGRVVKNGQNLPPAAAAAPRKPPARPRGRQPEEFS